MNSQFSKTIKIPLTDNQKRLWSIQNLNKEDPQYHVCFCVSLMGPVDIEKVKDVFQIILNKYCAYKTGFLSIEEAFLLDQVKVDFRYENWMDEKRNDSSTTLISKLKERAEIPFDLTKAPLARVHLIQVNQEEFLLLFVAHHMINDAASFYIVIDDFKLLYDSMTLTPIPDDKNEYITRQNQRNEFERTTGKEYWLNKLNNASILDFPTDKLKNTYEPDIVEYLFDLDPDLINQVQKTAKTYHSSTFKFLFSCYAILLHRYTLQDNFIVGVPSHGRLTPNSEKEIGFFVKLLPILTSFDENMSFMDLLNQTTFTINEAVQNIQVPYTDLLHQLKLARNATHDPLFNNYFNIALFDNFCDQKSLDLKIDYVWSSGGFTHSLFGLLVNRLNTRYQISFKYDAKIFEFHTIVQMVDHWHTIIREAIRNPLQLISKVPLFTSSAQQKSLTDVSTDPERTIIDVLNRHGLNHPQDLAVMSHNQQLTYGQLHKKTMQLSHYLIKNYAIQKGDVIAVLMEHDVDLLIGVLAIIRCGATYVSIDSHYPPNRIQYILEDSAAKLLITKRALMSRLSQDNKPALFFIDENPLNDYDYNELPVLVNPSDLVYLVYTSGTTGTPKGVKTTHKGLLNLGRFVQKDLLIRPDSRILQFAGVGFDAFAYEWSAAIHSGATLVFSNELLVGEELINCINQFSITHIVVPPSILETITCQAVPSLKTVVVAGEACSQNIVNNWSSHLRLINAYGPSENTVCSTSFLCNPQYPAATIGKSIDHVQVYILDKYLNEVPQGVIGELHVGGSNLSPGYVNKPELTEKKFIPNPFSQSTEKLYKTGDLVKSLPDGNIIFMGRMDFQIKLRGFRIELDEIIVQINQTSEVEHTEILVVNPKDQPPYLAAFIVFHDKNTQENIVALRIADIEKQIHLQLPAYMIPEIFIALVEMPLTENKKVDRNFLLKKLEEPSITTRDTNCTPTENILLQLWQQVLHKENISLKANFFDLGGHSLSVVYLIEKIKEHFQVAFHSIDLYNHPTIKQLATYIDGQQNTISSKNNLFIPLSQNAKSKKVYCLHPIGGNVLCYLPLANNLKHHADFYGISSLGLSPQEEPLTSITDMAQHYFNGVKEMQPQGPYYIIGYCMGGLIAYELAKLLLNNHDEVGRLVIVDAYTPEQVQVLSPLSSDCDFMALFLRMTLVTAGKTEYVEGALMQLFDAREPFRMLIKILIKHNLHENNQQTTTIELMIRVLKANYLALNQYVFNTTPTKIDGCFIYSDQTIASVASFEDSIFKQAIFKNENALISTSCNHEQIMLENYVGDWMDFAKPDEQ